MYSEHVVHDHDLFAAATGLHSHVSIVHYLRDISETFIHGNFQQYIVISLLNTYICLVQAPTSKLMMPKPNLRSFR